MKIVSSLILCFLLLVTSQVSVTAASVEVAESEMSLKDVVSSLQQLQLDNDQLLWRNSEQAHLIDLLNNRITEIESKLKSTQAAFETTTKDMSREISALKTSAEESKLKLDVPPVMFSALLSHNVPLVENATLVFDHVITNTGGGYDPNSGVFTAPVDGYFRFEMHVMNQIGYQTQLCLLVNGEYTFGVFADDMLVYQSAYNGGIVQLSKGQTVKVISFGTTITFGNSSYSYSSFSGHLLAPV